MRRAAPVISVVVDGARRHAVAGEVRGVAAWSPASDPAPTQPRPPVRPARRSRSGATLKIVAITPDGKTAYVVNRDSVTPISTATNKCKPGRACKARLAATTDGGARHLYRSANGGKTWAGIAVPGTQGGTDLSSLSSLSHTAGWVVAGGPGASSQNRLLRTSDAGATWHAVGF
jgi:hypothetical protein